MGWGRRRGSLVDSVDRIHSGVPGSRIINLGGQDLVQYVILEMRCEIITLIDRIIETFFDKTRSIYVWEQLRSLTLKTGFKIKDIEDVIEALKLFDRSTIHCRLLLDVWHAGPLFCTLLRSVWYTFDRKDHQTTPDASWRPACGKCLERGTEITELTADSSFLPILMWLALMKR